MDTPVPDWLTRIGTLAFFWSLGLFVVINGIAAVLFVSRQNREMVNRWTGRLLAVDLMLIGTGIGVPLVTGMTRLAVTTISAPLVTPAAVGEVQGIDAIVVDPAGR